MLVKSAMATNLLTIKPQDSLKKAMEQLCNNKISGLPVVDSDNKLVGIISEKDILKAMFVPTASELYEFSHFDFDDIESRYQDIRHLQIDSIMTRKVQTISPEDNLIKAASLMLLNSIRRLPVVDENGQLLGIISQGDVHQAIFKKYLQKTD